MLDVYSQARAGVAKGKDEELGTGKEKGYEREDAASKDTSSGLPGTPSEGLEQGEDANQWWMMQSVEEGRAYLEEEELLEAGEETGPNNMPNVLLQVSALPGMPA